MKVIVNNIEVKNEKDIENALLWENQHGEYAKIEYIIEKIEEYKTINKNLEFYNDKCLYTMRNWYNDNEECVDRNGNFKYLNSEKSYKYNVKKIKNIIEKDGIQFKQV